MNIKNGWLLMIALVGVLISSCAKSEGEKQAFVYDGFGSGEVHLITLEDGTRCAVLIGFSKGAIDCSWK